MAPLTHSLGSSAILRLAGSPVRLWLASANPELFGIIRELNRTQERYEALGAAVAERIGETLVPRSELERCDRRLALAIRRQLHNGTPLDAHSCRQLVNLARTTGEPVAGLIAPLTEALRLSEQLVLLEQRAEAAVAAETDRLAKLPWAIVQSSGLIGRMLRHRSPEVFVVLQRRAENGGIEAKQSEYVWEMIERAATKCTPRDWHGHVALYAPTPGGAGRDGCLAASAEVALHWMENVHQQRRTMAAKGLAGADASTRIHLTPLHTERDGYLECWVVDPDRFDHLTEVRLKLSSFLAAVCAPLRHAGATLQELEAAAVPDGDPEERVLLRGFVDHLVGIGVFEVSNPLASRLDGWQPLQALTPPASSTSHLDIRTEVSPANRSHPGFLDVYRRASGGLDVSCGALQRDILQALQVLTMITTDQTMAGGSQFPVDGRPHHLIELFRQSLDESEPQQRHGRPPRQWPLAAKEDSAYAKLLKLIGSRADDGGVVQLTASVLDEIGAPAGSIDWPLDCVVRIATPGTGYGAVFDEAFPAGALDARLVPDLSRLHGGVPHAEAYARFLSRLEEESGITFVELLIPPLARGAANAVRRPVYTRAWTGDTDRDTYLGAAPGPSSAVAPRYIPLDAITLRWVDNRWVAEVDGVPICPMYHASRLPLAAWSMLANTLCATTPLPVPWSPRRLDLSLGAFPERHSMPRITVGEGLVLAPAQWRIDSRAFGNERASTLIRARRLEQIRGELGLPRWVFLHNRAARNCVACDLESLRALKVLSRASRADSEVILTEMLPPPDRFPVQDRAHQLDDRLASCLMLRLPVDESPEEMAVRVAGKFAGLGAE